MEGHKERNDENIILSREEELIERVEKAAREGAEQGGRKASGRGGSTIGLFTALVRLLIALLPILLIGFVIYRVHTMQTDLHQIIEREDPAEQHDLVLENRGILGYTAADFQEAILGDSTQLKKLEVYVVNVSEPVQISKTGLANLKVFSKNQLITYKGTATYSVDLGKLTKDSITLDEEKMTVHLKIPHAVLEPINIPEDSIEYSDVKRGLLAIGDLRMTPEEISEVQQTARSKMEEKLASEHTIDDADRFAKMSVWEIYQPIVDNVTSGYSLEVEFAD